MCYLILPDNGHLNDVKATMENGLMHMMNTNVLESPQFFMLFCETCKKKKV